MRGESELQQVRENLPSLLIIDDADDIVELISELFVNEYSCIKALDSQYKSTIKPVSNIDVCGFSFNNCTKIDDSK